MKKGNSKNFVHVRCGEGNSMIIAIPVSSALRLQEAGIIFEYHLARHGLTLCLDPQFDDIALAIPGSFIIH